MTLREAVETTTEDDQRTLSQQLADYLAELSLDDVPAEVKAITVSCILDTIGVTLAGSAMPWARSVIDAVRVQAAEGDTTILGTPYRAPVSMAGLANGTSGHSLDFDDDNAQVHVNAAVVPAALAVAEHVGASGSDLIRAVLVGNEAAVRVGWFVRPERLSDRGFHGTGVCNTFGVAAAAAVLLGADSAQLAHTFGIAGTLAGGLLEFYSDGAMTKRLNAGHAANAGINAALIAAAGGTGPATVFEGRWGVGRAFAGEMDSEAITGGLGERFLILDTGQKYYPMNFAIHSSIDATLELMKENNLGVDDVAKIVARVRPNNAEQFNTAAAYDLPTVLSAQMSLPFGVATAMLRGTVTLDEIDEEWIAREDMRSLMRRVGVESDPDLEHEEGVESGTVLPARVTLTTTGGQEYHRKIVFQRGDPRNPLGDDDLRTKFEVCARRVLSAEQVALVLDQLATLEQLEDVRVLTDLLRA